MWGSAFKQVPAVVLALTVLVGAGCTTVPQQEFKAYTEAFAEVKSTTEQLLLEYDTAKRIDTEAKSGRKPIPSARPYPSAVTLSFSVDSAAATDHVGARRQALEVVSNFNAALVSLAEGKDPAEVKSNIESLSGGLSNVATLLGGSLSIPFVGQAAGLISTVVTKLDEAKNRQEFVAALKEAAPIIQAILRLFAQDAQDIYRIRAAQTDRLWTNHQENVATLVRQMRDVAGEYDAARGDHATELQAMESSVRELLNRVGLQKNSEKLQPAASASAPAAAAASAVPAAPVSAASTAGASKPAAPPPRKPFDQLVLSQLQQTLVQAQTEAAQYEAVIKAQTALLQLVTSYGRLLAQTDSTLTATRAALDRPADIRKQVNELVSVVFAVKRDWEALNAARRTGG